MHGAHGLGETVSCPLVAYSLNLFLRFLIYRIGIRRLVPIVMAFPFGVRFAPWGRKLVSETRRIGFLHYLHRGTSNLAGDRSGL